MVNLNESNENATATNTGESHIPFIKLFRTPRGHYFFDVNRDMVCPISADAYKELSDIMDGEEIPFFSQELSELKEAGWLSDHRPIGVKHMFSGKAKSWLDGQVFDLVLQVTQACNLCCIYCPYANNPDQKLFRSHSSKTMTIETAKKAIDFLAEKSTNASEVFISFYGGEPLIAFPLIKQCVTYADEAFLGRNIKYSITTNATLLTDEMLDFMWNNRFMITFSLDGPQKIHDKHRIRGDGSPTYDDVMRILEKTVEKYGNESMSCISINMVLNPNNSLTDTVEWLSADIFEKIQVRASLIENDYLENKFQVTDTYIAEYNYYYALQLLKYLKLVDGIDRNLIVESGIQSMTEDYARLRNDSVQLPDISSPSGPCLSGVRKLFVNVNGDFFPCEKVNELSSSMMIGSLDNGFNYEQIEKHLNIASLTPDKCRSCWAQQHCTICQRQADGGDELSARTKTQFCPDVERSLLSTLYACTLLNECKTVYKPITRKQ